MVSVALFWKKIGILTLDEILDLHGCKCDANGVANIEHSYLHHANV